MALLMMPRYCCHCYGSVLCDIAYFVHTQGFYSVYSMVFERIKNEDDQFRDDSDGDKSIPQFGQSTLLKTELCPVVKYSPVHI